MGSKRKRKEIAKGEKANVAKKKGMGLYVIAGSIGIVLIALVAINLIGIVREPEIQPKPVIQAELEMQPESENVGEEIMRWNTPPPMTINEQVSYTAILTTNKGVIEIELFNEYTPITVNNFVFLAKAGFYDNVIFHRIIEGFMIQGGCPLGTGVGSPGYTIVCEFAGYNKNTKGTISMANAGPNTGGSQFFINLADNSWLDGRHTVFGRVIAGMDVVDVIGAVETGPRDRPIDSIIIENIEIKD